MKVSRTQYRVIYGDIDAMGITYYGNYFRWFEIGRTEFLRELGLCYRDIERWGFILPVTETFCKYISPAYYDTVVTIETKLDWLKKASLRFDYKILGQEDGLELANGYTIHACLDHDRRIARIPSFLSDRLQGVMVLS